MASTIYDIIIRAVDNAKSTLNGTGQQLDNLDKKAAKVNASLAALGTGVTRFAQAGALAFSVLTLRALNYADTISDTAEATDVSIKTILALQAAATGSAVTLGDLSTALLRFNENLGVAASSGGKQLRETLAQVGIGLTDLANLPTDQLLIKALENLAQIPDKSKQAALATDIFGKSIRGLPLDKVSQDLRKQIQEQQHSADAVLRSAQLMDNYERALNTVSVALLEVISPLVDFINKLAESEGAIDSIISTLKVLGVVVATVFAFTAVGAAVRIIGTIGRGFSALIGIIRNVGGAISLNMFAPMSKFMQVLRGVGGLIGGLIGGTAAYKALFGDDKKKDDKPKATNVVPENAGFSGRNIEPLKNDVQKVRNVLATAQESFDEANAAYKQLINVFQNTKDVNLQALQFAELSRAAEVLGIVIEKPTRLIERDFTLALKKSAEELRINGEQLKMSGLQQQKYAQELATANQALLDRKQRLQDVNLQQGLFDNLVESNRIQIDEQNATLARANAALSTNQITLREYATIVSSLPPELLDLTDKQKLLQEQFNKELKAQKDSDALAIYNLELARASGNVRAFLDAYSQYKNIFGATAEGELATAIKGAKDDIKLTDARKKAYAELATQFERGEVSARLFREAAKGLGIDEGEVNRIAALYGSTADQIQYYNEQLEKSVQRLANKFEDDLTQAIMSGKNLFSSFKDFVGSILNEIASQIIKQQIAAPIANALGGLAKGLGSSIFGKVAAPGQGSGSAFGALGNWFAGFFAEGGTIGAGKIGVVGEAGPEFVTGPARVIPSDKAGPIGGDTINVNFSINAIDTQTGVEFLMRNKPVLSQVIEQAYNKRGRRGPMSVG